ncbi:hypothetical protein [Chitiniphilus eburneus]|uniref:hypothetical protein n=1 Tax=Chitiniphilus eburneus TaxID=2571148 RepID=UPI0035D0A074
MKRAHYLRITLSLLLAGALPIPFVGWQKQFESSGEYGRSAYFTPFLKQCLDWSPSDVSLLDCGAYCGDTTLDEMTPAERRQQFDLCQVRYDQDNPIRCLVSAGVLDQNWLDTAH